jgi:hypothetical protein
MGLDGRHGGPCSWMGLSSRSIKRSLNSFWTQACQSSTCILVRRCRYSPPSATEGEERSFRTIAVACSRYDVVVAGHLVANGKGTGYSSAFLGGL